LNIPKVLKSILGMEESQMLEVINRGFPDVNSIHLLTGIPIDCIEHKISALMGLKLIKLTDKGYIIDENSMIIWKERECETSTWFNNDNE